MAKQPFRSIGLRVRDFARMHIRSYVPSGELVSRSELPPSWQADSAEPLVWREDAAPSTPAPTQPAPDVQEARQEPANEAPQQPGVVTHRMLERLLAAHEERMAREGTAPQPIKSPNSSPAPVQRQIEPSNPETSAQPSAEASGETPPRMVTRRRRGAVIDVPSPNPATSNDEDAPPDFFFLNEAAPQTPAVQRAPASLPAPQTPQEAPKSSSPATSFWRRLFSRGDESSASPEAAGKDSSAVQPTSPSDEPTGTQPPTSAETPSFASGSTPAVQRASDETAAPPASQPSIQRAVSETPFDAPTILTPEDLPFSPVPPQQMEQSKPASASSASPAAPTGDTPQTPPAVQRSTQSEAIQRSAAPEQPDVDSSEVVSTPAPPVTSTPATTPVQREVSGSQPSITNDQPARRVQRQSRGTASGDQPSDASQQQNTDAPAEAAPHLSAQTPFTPAVETTVQREFDAEQPFTPEAAPASETPDAPRRSTAQASTGAQPSQPTLNQTSAPNVQRQTDTPASQVSAETPAPTSEAGDLSHAFMPAQSGTNQPTVQRSAEPQSHDTPAVQDANVPAPTISRRENSASTPSVQRQTDSSGDHPIVPLREEPVAAVQRQIESEGGSADIPAVDAPEFGSQQSAEPPSQPTPSVQRQSNADISRTAPPQPTSVIHRDTVQRSPAPEIASDPSFAPDPSEPPQQDWQINSQPASGSAPSVQRKADARSDQSGGRPTARRIQRSAQQPASTDQFPAEHYSDEPQTDHPSTFTPPEEQEPQAQYRQTGAPPSSGDAPTMLTPAAHVPNVQRSAESAVDSDSNEGTTYETGTYTADAPTILTPVPPQTQPAAANPPSVQHQHSGFGSSEAAPPPMAAGPSPWAAFMQPSQKQRGNQAAPPVQRSTDSQIQRHSDTAAIQREIQNPPASPAPQRVSQSWNDDTPSIPEQPVDLFTALSDAGMIPSAPLSSASTPSTPPISRRSQSGAVQRSSQASSVSESGVSRVPSAAVPDSSVTDNDATDAELLSLIDLPPTTPVIRQSPASPTVSRSVSPAPQERRSESYSPPIQQPSIEEHGFDGSSVMRALTTAPDQSSSSSENAPEDGAPEEEAEEVNVDKLARDVLDVLRQRLRIEQERRGGRP